MEEDSLYQTRSFASKKGLATYLRSSLTPDIVVRNDWRMHSVLVKDINFVYYAEAKLFFLADEGFLNPLRRSK